MKFFLIPVISLISLQLSAQQVTVNDPNAKQRTITASFTSISVGSGVELLLSQGNEVSLAVSASDPKHEEKLKTVVENGVLKIYYDNGGLKWVNDKKRALKAYLSFKDLEKITAHSGATIKSSGPLEFNRLQVKINSGAQIYTALKAETLIADMDSGGEAKFSGSVEKLTITSSSGALFKGYDLKTNYCTAKVNSGGAIHISIEKELSAKATSGGSIRYQGNALIKDLNVNSGGSVQKTKI